MGYDLERFTKPVDEDFKCSICLAVLENPLATPCGHVFCGNCVLPWVVQHGSCPLKCDKFSTKELNSVLPLRNLIMKLEIRCDNHTRGCQEVVKIQMLPQHLEDCDFAPVTCTNKGCEAVVSIKDLVQHQTQQCEYRAVGRCEQGCNLVLQHNAVADHCCLKAMQAHCANLQAKISSQEHGLKKTTVRFGKREKSLLAQIACLQNEIQMQALRYQKKLNECKAEVEYMSAMAVYDRPCEEVPLALQLGRENGSLGFNIIGGNRVDGISEGIIVSRVIEHGPADKSELRLHDRITKVNGVDLSKATHEEAVEAFKNATEPIIVQVLRRAPRSKVPGDKEGTTALCNVGTQTELQSEDLLWKVLQRCPSPLETKNGDLDMDGLCEISPQEQMTVIDDDLMNDLDAMDNVDIPILDEDGMDKAYELEYEDVTLRRTSDGAKLGLTLCYGTEEDTGIFIKEVDPNSIAGEDGRIKEGDQILQINGEDVHSNDQALSLFAQQSDSTSLLLCRSQLQFDECLFDEHNALLEDIQLDMLEQTHQEAMQFTSCLLAEHDSRQLDDDSKTDTTGTTETTSLHHEKDSGVGRATDESVRNDESSGQENMPDDCSSTHRKYAPQQANRLGNRDLRYSNDSFISNGATEADFPTHEISLEDCMKFQAALESKCDKHMRSDTDESTRGKESKVMRLGSDSMETTSLSGDSLSRTSRNRSGASDQDEATQHRDDSKSSIWVAQQNGQKNLEPNGQPGVSPEEPEDQRFELESRKLEMIVENGQVGSPTHRPTELVLDGLRNSDNSLHRMSPSEKETKTMTSSSSGSTRQHRAPRTVPGSPGRSKSSSGSRDRSKSSSSSGSGKEKSSPVKTATDKDSGAGAPPYPSKPYRRRPATNPHLRAQQFVQRNPYFLQQEEAAAHLIRQNWKLQQQNRQLKKSLESLGPAQKLQSCPSIMSIPSHAKHYRSYLHLVNQNEENTLGTSQPSKKIINHNEWKVKIRSDGTRYITKKNTRGKILKDRANKIQEERGGLTTDDEAMSEMKLGRYWSKEDRKRHLERARDQRLRREYMVQSRMECLQEQMEEEGRKELNIVELSQRKMLKKKSGRKMMLDDFTTIQEMLVHGTRVSPETAKAFYNPLLNVTTV